ncbi:hypothetical protein AB0M95_39600 [Sphaerisporangium sp. NPDC051017]
MNDRRFGRPDRDLLPLLDTPGASKRTATAYNVYRELLSSLRAA